MKRKIFAILVVMLLVLGLFACNGKVDEPEDDIRTFTPLADLVDYGSDAKYYNVSSINYGSTAKQDEDLQRAIDDEKEEYAQKGGKGGEQFENETQAEYEERLKDRSTASKIFENATPEGIIATLAKAALPKGKMEKTVAYLAGEETKNGTYNPKTANFIDDLDELDRLKDEADNKSGKTEQQKNDDKDNVARQERLIMGKVFAIGMTGDEFARVATEGLIYVQSVLDGMIEEYNTDNGVGLDRDEYCKEVLKDYGFLVYIMSFNDVYYGMGKGPGNPIAPNGKLDCTRLYGYYYDYNKKGYDTLSEADFELQLKYSHQDTFTDREWSDYLRIQKLNYKEAYRYTDGMYIKINKAQTKFKSRQEINDETVYPLADVVRTAPYNTRASDQATKAQGYIKYQLEMSDLLYFYAEDKDGKDTPEIMAYNRANTEYQNALSANNDDKDAYAVAIPRLKFEYAQLEIADYLLNKMGNDALTGVLKFQIHTYGADSVASVQAKRKEIRLYELGIKEASEDELADFTNQDPQDPGDATTIAGYIYDTPNQEAAGRRKAIEFNMTKTHKNADTQAKDAGQAAWNDIRKEVKATLTQEYNYNATGQAAEKERLKFEDTLIKKNYHKDAQGNKLSTYDYDTDHATSRLLNNHKPVFMHAMGKKEVVFAQLSDKDGTPEFSSSKEQVFGAGKTLPAKAFISAGDFSLKFNATASKKVEYEKDKSPTDADLGIGNSSDVNKPTNITKKPEVGGMSSSTYYEYTFVFEGWYLDQGLKYKFIPGSDLECDMTLYAGYTITKVQRNK